MLKVIIAFFILLASVYLGIQLSADPGYLFIKINHWTIETTAWVALIGLFLCFGCIYMVLQLCHSIARAPEKLRHWKAHRRAQKAQAITRQGLIEYSEGYWKKAKNHLIKALPNTDTPLLNYLTAARAAQKMGDSQLRDHYLREAQQSMPEAKIAVELTQAELQLANQQWEQALATLRHLQDLAPHHPYVLKLLVSLYEQVRDWQLLIQLLPDIKRNQVVTDAQFILLEKKAYLNTLIDLVKQNQPQAIQELFSGLPKHLTKDADILNSYINFLMQNQQEIQAEKLLRRHLAKDMNPQLVKLYSEIETQASQLTFAESLLKKNPHNAPLFLCLGKLCMHQHLWGKAINYLEQSIMLQPTPQCYMCLGQLHEQLEDAYLAGENYKKGLDLAIQPKNAI